MMTIEQEFHRKKFKDLYDKAMESDQYFENIDQTSINFFDLVFKASSKNLYCLFKGNNLCIFKCKYYNDPYMMIIFGIPSKKKSETSGKKFISERIIDLIKCVEDCLITVDKMKSFENQDDKFVYLSCMKKINKE